ncbi:MAG: hypothetical protein HY259_12080 [Chloroflexi bacterium]|nr:hypothetical protein [Chloroflexota bacterium]
MAVVHQLRAHDGRGSTDAPALCVVPRANQRPPLYVLIDCLPPDDNDQLTTRIAKACAQAYRQARGHPTGALAGLVRAARAAAPRSGAAENTVVGISALSIGDGEAFLSQVEPAACWLLRDGALTRWPALSPWLNPRMTNHLLAVLIADTAEEPPAAPMATRIPVQDGDRLLLATSAVARQIGDFLIAEAMAQEDPAFALHELAPDLEFTAVSLAIQHTGPTPGAARGDLALRGVAPTPQRTASLERAVPQEPEPAYQRKPPTARAPQARPQRSQDSSGQGGLWNLLPYAHAAGYALLLALKALWAVLRFVLGFLARMLPAHDQPEEPRATHPAQRASRATSRSVKESQPWTGRVLLTLAVCIPLLVLVGSCWVSQEQGAAQQRRVTDLAARATTAYQSALGEVSPDTRKTVLITASQLVEEAISLSPKDASLKALQLKVGAELDQLANVTKFFFHPVLAEFKDKDSKPTAVVARGNEIYVLDSGLNRLYKFLLNEAKDDVQQNPNPIVMRQGDQRGAMVVGALADIFWGTPGGGRGNSSILTLTAGRQVVEYLPAKGINALNLGAVVGWEEATLAESFNGNVYVLDARTNRILKYQPTGDEYRNPPADYVAAGERVDFAGATDMAIDGFLYVLIADGTLMKFDSGHLIPFERKGLDLPLRKPVAMVAQVNSPSLYIADAGNQRIVQLSKSGEYQRQLKPDLPAVMSNLRGLSVDELNKRFYFINDNKLYMGTLQN